jgi:hypothetical protein
MSCSRQAALISETSSAVLRMLGTRVVSISPADWAALTVSDDTAPISVAAVCERSASLRTSEATTAKPRPCSPARAASTAAFRASRSVWRAISCTMVIFSAIVRMASTARLTASPEISASLADWRAIFSVWAALSAFCLMLEAISSIEAEASSADEACSVAPCDTCSEAADSSWLPAETFSEAEIASETTPRRRSTIRCRAMPRVSLSDSGLASTVRSPSATLSATAAVARRLSVMRLTVSTRSLISSLVVTMTR